MAKASVHGICQAFRAHLRRLLLLAGAGRLAVLITLFLAASLLFDWSVHLPRGWRLLPLLTLAALVYFLVRYTLLAPLRQRWSDREVLSHLDATAPPGEGMLLDLFELERGEEIEERAEPEGAVMHAEALARLAPNVAQAPLGTSLNTRRANAWLVVGCCCLAACTLAALLMPEHTAIGLERFFNPFSSQRWPHRTTIVLDEPATGWKIPQGESFALTAQVSGEIPSDLTLAYLSEDLGFWMEERLTVDADGHVAYSFPTVNDPLSFQLHGGDYSTDLYDVEITRRPRLEKIVAHYEYPDYAGVPSRDVESGQIAGLEGSRVTLTFTSNLPLQKAIFVWDGKEEELASSSETEFSKELLLEKDGTYALHLFDKDGFRESRPEIYEVRVTPDQIPEVSLLAPGQDLEATTNASIDFSLRAKDDFGLQQVEFFYQLDGGEVKSLSDRITGPLKARGKEFERRFTWDLARSEWPKSDRINLTYFIRVKDVNPTGRGVVESTRFQLNLLKPSVFREQLFQAASALMNEALIAEAAQREAYHIGREWVGGKATGKENDELWLKLTDKQETAFRAAEAMEGHMRRLSEQYEMNRIAYEFMSGRLASAGRNLREILDKHHPAIQAALDKTRPRSDAEAAPARLQQTRNSSVSSVLDKPVGTKMAALLFQRILSQLYDWRDLQGAAFGSLRITERQEEVARLSKKIAPKFLGKDIKDLSDNEQDGLFELGKQQSALFDMETALEAQLRTLWYKAEQEKRSSFDALKQAFGRLRQARVNDNLSRASHAIQNNQTADILELQQNATRVIREVTSGLEHAGQFVEKLPPLTLAMDVKKVDVELVSKAAGEEGEVAQSAEPPPPTFRADKASEDPLTTAISETKDNLLAAAKRMKYIHGNMGPKEMPRFVTLKMGMLQDRQADALTSLSKSDGAAREAKAEHVAAKLTDLRQNMEGARDALAKREVMPRAQQVLGDDIEACEDLIQFLARLKAVAEMQAEHDRAGGVDAFNRPYVLREGDLRSTVEAITAFDCARLDVCDAARMATRFASPEPGTDTLLHKQETARRAIAATLLQRAQSHREAGRLALGKIGESARAAAESKAADALGTDLAALREALARGGKDAEVAASLTGLGEHLLAAIDGLRDLADARGEAPQPPEDQKQNEEVPQEVAKMTEEEYAKRNTKEALAERLRAAEGLPAAVRESLLRGLKQPLPEKYRPLLTAFVNSCLTPVQPEAGKTPAPRPEAAP